MISYVMDTIDLGCVTNLVGFLIFFCSGSHHALQMFRKQWNSSPLQKFTASKQKRLDIWWFQSVYQSLALFEKPCVTIGIMIPDD